MLSIGILLVVALFTALIAPLFIDWTSFRADFEREASRVAGQPVRVSGQADVRILPLPSVTFKDIAIGAYPDGSPMMTIEAFSMNVELMPFLSGEVRIVDMMLDRPKLFIHVNENGTIDWTDRKAMPVDPERVKIDNLSVRNGSFELTGLAGGRRIAGESIAATVSAQSLAGPWRIEARGLVDEVASEFSITTGRMQETGSIRIKTVARRLDQPYVLTADGAVAIQENVLGWSGNFELAARGTAEQAARDVAEPLPILLTGSFQATPQAVDAPEYRLEIGPREDPYTITGNARATFADAIQFRVEADGRQIDLDTLAPATEISGPAAGIETRIAALRSLLDRIPIPEAEGVIDFELPAIVAGDTVIRQVSAAVRPQFDAWQIERFSATLPGNTTVEAKGLFGAGQDFGFTGSLLVASRQPTGFANWLSGRTNEQLRAISSAGLQAQVLLTPNQATFEDMELSLDGATLRGKLQRLAGGSGRPAMVAELRGDLIDLDNLIAVYALAQSGEVGALTNHDLDVTLLAGVLRASGMEAGGVDARVKVEGGGVSIDRLNAEDFYGASIRSEGRLADLLDRASGSLRLKVTAEDGSELARFASERIGGSRLLDALALDAELAAAADLDIELDARPEGDGAVGAIGVTGRIGGTEILFRDRFNGELAKWASARHDVTLKLVQERPDILARQLSLPVLPVDAPGPVELDAEFAGAPDATMTGVLALRAGQTDMTASGSVGFSPAVAGSLPDFGKPILAFEVTAGSQDADPWLMLAGYPLPGSGQGNPASLTFQLNGGDGKYRFSGLAGQYAGVAFSGETEFDAAREGRPKLSGDLDFAIVSAPFMGELATGSSTLATDGLGADAEAQFGQPLFAGFDADLSLTAGELDLGAAASAVDFSGKLTVADGSLSLPEFRAQWLGGTLSGAVSLANANGSAKLNAQLRLDGFSLEEAVALGGFPPFLGGAGNLGVTVESAGRSRQALLADLTGSGVVRVMQAQLRGVGLNGFGAIVTAADAEGFKVSRDTVLPLAQSAFLGGQIDIASLETAFTINQGQAVARNIQFATAEGRVAGEASLSLLTGEAGATLTMTLDPGRDAVEGGEPGIVLQLDGQTGAFGTAIDTTALEGYLSIRAFEAEERRVALLEASVLEKQRHRREVIATNARIAMREQARLEELRRLEELQRKLEEERLMREEAARKAAEEEAARKAAEEAAARKAAEEEAARKAAEEEAARKAAEEAAARKAAEEEAARKAAEARSPPAGGELFRNIERLFRN